MGRRARLAGGLAGPRVTSRQHHAEAYLLARQLSAAIGWLYVAYSGNRRIMRMEDMTGAGWSTWAARVSLSPDPTCIFLDAARHIYTADLGNHRIARMMDLTRCWLAWAIERGLHTPSMTTE